MQTQKHKTPHHSNAVTFIAKQTQIYHLAYAKLQIGSQANPNLSPKPANNVPPPLAQARPRSQKSGQNGGSTPTLCLDKTVHAHNTRDSKGVGSPQVGMARGREWGTALYQKRHCAQYPSHSACTSNGCSCPHDERDQKYWQTHVPQCSEPT
jgi:hypothetical protein